MLGQGEANSDIIIGRVMMKGKSIFSLRAELEKNVTQMLEYILEVLPYSTIDLLTMAEDRFFMAYDRAKEAYQRKIKLTGNG